MFTTAGMRGKIFIALLLIPVQQQILIACSCQMHPGDLIYLKVNPASEQANVFQIHVTKTHQAIKQTTVVLSLLYQTVVLKTLNAQQEASAR